MKKKNLLTLMLPIAAAIGLITFNALKNDPPPKHKIAIDNAGLTLPAGFSASTLVDNLPGGVREMAVTPQGDLYAKIYKVKAPAKGVVVLHVAGDKATVKTSFGTGFSGSGMYIKNGYLYASSDQEVFRYKLDSKNEVIDPEHPEKIVTGLIARREHQPKAILVDNNDNLYVNIGAFSNSCQEKDRQFHSMGMKGCPVLDSAAGIWQFKADKLNQHYSDGVRYATGLRNVVGMDWNTQANQLFVMQHGRDGLHDIFPEMFDTKQSSLLPAECMYALKKGDNGGWPYIYYDQIQHKKIVAPEYGGDGKKTGGESAIDPIAAYPGHLAPDALLFYTGNQFPEKYKNGAFIAFHGSWNRAPEPQAGYFVVFQPFKDGKPDGQWEVFANGFAGTQAQTESGRAEHRPCGLVQAPDGSIYVSDDTKGTIYKISYKK
ncbi:MAG TPA: PQQ-dependent sugar dehydrogenase [Mucilaginibacter sp.]